MHALQDLPLPPGSAWLSQAWQTLFSLATLPQALQESPGTIARLQLVASLYSTCVLQRCCATLHVTDLYTASPAIQRTLL